jgi:hypothetical protein
MRIWGRGEQVVWRSRLDGPVGPVGYVIPMTVVADTTVATVLFQAPGCRCMRRAGRRGGPRGRSLLPGQRAGHEERIWEGPPTLRLHAWGTAHAVIRSWDPATGSARGWYVNIEDGWRRTRLGFDSRDLALDVTVADDLSSWAWKDEDKLAWSVAAGTISPADAEAARAEGLRAIAALEARAWPFVDDWSAWRPDPSWPVPGLPDGWDDPSI